MRIVLSIDANWTVNSNVRGMLPRQLIKATNSIGAIVPVLDAAQHASEPLTGLMVAGATDINATYDRLMSRSLKPGDPEAFGRYLFDCLVGANWSELCNAVAASGDWFVEVALSWDPTDMALSRLPWELMQGPDDYISNGYLRRGRRVGAAITRIVPQTTAVPRQIEGLPRLLFAVGTSLVDATVRPAAEILCMLKRTREQHRRIHPRMLERVSPSRLETAVRNFRPDVVHLICHGGIAGGVPFIWLQSETASGEDQFTAGQIAASLQSSGSPPPIVLLSACQSGTAMLGPKEVAPFAAQLVRLGIPIVIGMSGKVSDIACRLFTRRFAESLLGADPLIEATAEGRRAAFAEGKAPEKSIDWAFPAVYLSTGVQPDYQPADNMAPQDPSEARIRTYSIRSVPTFCGRQNFFQEFEALFSDLGPSVLAAYTPDATVGYGRKRLLEELAVQAILDRNVPVLVTSRTWKDPQQPPTTPLGLALEIDRSVETACRAFGVKLSPMSPAKKLQQLVDNKFAPAFLASFDEDMRAALTGSVGEVPPEAAMLAIEQRLTDLITKIRAHYQQRMDDAVSDAQGRAADDPLTRAARHAATEYEAIARGRVVVMLDSIQSYDAALQALLSQPSLGDTGLGNKGNPAPVVVTFSLKHTGDTILDPMVQGQAAQPGWRFLPLNAFERNGENLLAYARILLTPFDLGGSIVPKISDRAWVIDDSVDPEIQNTHVGNFNKLLKGLPAELSQTIFYAVVLFATQAEFLKPARDDEYLAQLEEERKRL